MYSSMTAMIRLPERWQVANTLSGEKAFPGEYNDGLTNHLSSGQANETTG